MAILSFLKPYCLIECVRLSQPKRSLCISLLDSSCCDARAYSERGHTKNPTTKKWIYQIISGKLWPNSYLEGVSFQGSQKGRIELQYGRPYPMRFYVTSLKSVIHSYLLLDRRFYLCIFQFGLTPFFFFFPLAPILLLFVSHSFRSTSPTSWRRALIPITTATVTSPRSSSRTTLTSRREMSPSRGQLHTGRTGAPRVAFHNRLVCYPFRSSVLLTLKKIKWSNSPMTIMRVSGFENLLFQVFLNMLYGYFWLTSF